MGVKHEKAARDQHGGRQPTFVAPQRCYSITLSAVAKERFWKRDIKTLNC
jgi:hypothetical protein